MVNMLKSIVLCMWIMDQILYTYANEVPIGVWCMPHGVKFSDAIWLHGEFV